MQLSTLQPGLTLDHLRAREIAVRTPARRIHTDYVLVPFTRRKPNQQSSIVARFHHMRQLRHPARYRIEVKYTFARLEKASRWIFGKLLSRKTAKVRTYLPPKCNLRMSQSLAADQVLFLLRQWYDVYPFSNISWFDPPGKKCRVYPVSSARCHSS